MRGDGVIEAEQAYRRQVLAGLLPNVIADARRDGALPRIPSYL